MIELKFYLTKNDLNALERCYHSKGFLRRVQFVVIRFIALPFLMIIIPLFIVHSFWKWYGHISLMRLVMSNIPFLLPLLGLFLYHKAKTDEIRKSGILSHEIRVSFQEEGIWQKNHMGESLTYWNTISQIIHDTHHIFCFIGQEGVTKPSTAIIIPKSAFYDDVEQEKCVQYIHEHWQQPT